MSIDSDHVSCSGILQCIPSLHTVLINARSVRHSWFIQRFTSWTSWKKKLSSVLTCLRILVLTSQRSPDKSHVRVLALRQFLHKLLYSGYQPLGLYMIYSTNPLVFSWKEPLHSQWLLTPVCLVNYVLPLSCPTGVSSLDDQSLVNPLNHEPTVLLTADLAVVIAPPEIGKLHITYIL